MNKQQKIDQILALMNGKVSPADIAPRMVIHFNKDGGNIYLINGKPTDSETFHNLIRTLPAVGPLKTYGREDDTEEYYYGEAPLSIYKDNRPL